GQAIEVQTLHARGGNGTLDGSGQLALSFNPTSPFALRLRFDRFLAISQTAYEAATDGVLTVEGSLSYPVVRGDLTLTHLLIRPATLSSTSGPSLEADPTIEVVGLDTPPVEPPPPAPDVAHVLS